ncbi:MAG: DNA-binding response regulator [Caldilinea sp. CFX5]|nr:DNA-binding response regulator [Caldilinea sp. CFX5]
MPANIYITEDHPLVAEMLSEFINAMPGLQVCGAATTAQEAIDQIPRLTVDLVIIDVSLPDMDGIQLLQALRSQQPTLRCLMFSGHQERSYVQKALASGAGGYVAKGKPPELIDAINRVLQGEIYLSPSLRAAQPKLNK